ncbi:hypothetical protein Q5752_002744 [Cryptotrichosporon argae]
MSSALQNIYFERKVGTARACYVCSRPTDTVLATAGAADFVYTCDRHLADPATQIPTPGPSAEDVRKVVADYHVREARKAEAAKAGKDGAGKDKEGKEGKDDKDECKDKDKGKDGPASNPSAPTSSPSQRQAQASPAPTPTPPTHRKFALHRQLFESRKAELRRREQAAKAREMSRGLPQVPRGNF